jgi:hypothetical protein
MLVGELFCARHTIDIVVNRIDAGIVSETLLGEDIEGP